MFTSPSRLDDVHQAKSSRIVEGDDRTVRELEDDVVVSVGRAVIVEAERAGHAEVDEEHVAGAQVEQEIFPAPAERSDRLSFETRGEAVRKRAAEVGAPQQYACNCLPSHHPLETTPHRFDFRKLGHLI